MVHHEIAATESNGSLYAVRVTCHEGDGYDYTANTLRDAERIAVAAIDRPDTWTAEVWQIVTPEDPLPYCVRTYDTDNEYR